MGSKATLKEVARAAGVSVQTVSRVVNQSENVADETRTRILQIIDEIGYQPNVIARSLITRQTRTLGVIASGLEYYGPSSVLVGIQREAQLLGYSLHLYLLDDANQAIQPAFFREITGRLEDGLIWAVPPVDKNRDAFSPGRIRSLPPTIFFTQTAPLSSVVTIDNYNGAWQAVSHLFDMGYKQVGLLSGPLNWHEASERKRGWQAALAAQHIHPDNCMIVEGDWTPASGEQCFKRLVQANPQIDAIFVANDQMALGVYKAAYQQGIRIPEQLGVIGFDDIPEANFFTPSLSTIRQPLQDLGAASVREIVAMIRCCGSDRTSYEPKSITLQPKLIMRESTRKKS